MAGSFDPGATQASDFDVNAVPFIDLMSCLVAFLLVTTVWFSQAQVPGARVPPGPRYCIWSEEIEHQAEVLIAPGELWLSMPSGRHRRIPALVSGHDWRTLAALLEYLREQGRAVSPELFVAAEDSVTYQQIITAIDVAHGSGFDDVGVVSPRDLSARLKE